MLPTPAHRLILQLSAAAVLAAAPGCADSASDPASERFELDEPLAAEDIEAALDAQDLGPLRWDQLECADLCQTLYGSRRGWQANIDACAFELPDMDDPSSRGVVRCSGMGVESYCK